METIDRYSDTKLDVPLFDVMLNAKTINEIVLIDFQFFF
jgi:hypothetical protein